MNQRLAEIFGYSVGIAALIGLARVRTIVQAYFPFIIVLWLAIINEIATTIIINNGYSNALNNNVYDLLESLLILLLFRNWRLFEENRYLFATLLCSFGSGWAIENFVISSIHRFNSYFNIFYSFIIVLMSINMINKMFLRDRRGLIRNACFLICIGFIFFFTYKLLIEIFWVYGLNASKDFRISVYRIMMYINLVVNLIYVLATIWIPKKQESILR